MENDFKVGDYVNCGMCEGCTYQNGIVTVVYDETVEVSWGIAVNLWAKKDLRPAINIKKDEAPTCRHQFAAYRGLNESFNYCVFCDEKKS